MGMPTTTPASDRERGYYEKYNLSKKDGSPMDPKANYFVLRFDKNDAWGEACREAMKTLAVRVEDTYPELALDIYDMLRKHLGNQIAEQTKKL